MNENNQDIPLTEDKKPNGVLFKLDDGKLCVVLLKNNEWDWDNVHVLNTDNMDDKYDDISASDPFEFVFILWEEHRFTTCNIKTTVPNNSFIKLHDEGFLQPIIKRDYEKQYGTDN